MIRPRFLNPSARPTVPQNGGKYLRVAAIRRKGGPWLTPEQYGRLPIEQARREQRIRELSKRLDVVPGGVELVRR